jgi:hypothetical protein
MKERVHSEQEVSPPHGAAPVIDRAPGRELPARYKKSGASFVFGSLRSSGAPRNGAHERSFPGPYRELCGRLVCAEPLISVCLSHSCPRWAPRNRTFFSAAILRDTAHSILSVQIPPKLPVAW